MGLLLSPISLVKSLMSDCALVIPSLPELGLLLMTAVMLPLVIKLSPSLFPLVSAFLPLAHLVKMCSAASLRWLPCLVTLLDVTRCLVSPPLARVCPVCPLCAVTILPCPCPFPTLSLFLSHSQLVPLLWLLLLLASPSTSCFRLR